MGVTGLQAWGLGQTGGVFCALDQTVIAVKAQTDETPSPSHAWL